jgi:hypothetical protein
MNDLLFIVDADESAFADPPLASKRFDIPIKRGTKQLVEELDKLVSKGETFKRALFFTHGDPGLIIFNKTSNITSGNILDIFEPQKQYERLFPEYSRIYFDGCRVAAGIEGWAFPEAIGKVFLKLKGGLTSGFIGWGVGIWYVGTLHTPIPVINPTEGERQVFFGPGGEVIETEDEIGTRINYPVPTVKRLSQATLHIPVPPRTYDNVLMPILERHIRYDNPRAIRERVEALEKFFRQLESGDARALLTKLQLHRTDKLSRAFRHNLSTATRANLLQILRDRAGSH